jgi:hypothetical protein
MTLAAVMWLSLAAFILVLDGEPQREALPAPAAESTQAQPAGDERPATAPGDFRLPYDQYLITQGVHGYEYGHAAIDLGAGEGAPLYAPISGTVIVNTVDELQNTILVIENQRYAVTLMHGIYTVAPGDPLTIGDLIGSESNQGNTQDYDGVPCFYYGRDCGYHTHLNVLDKMSGQNVNPLDLVR